MGIQVASLEDYQLVTSSLWPWSRLGDEVEVTAFQDHVHDVAELARRLKPFEIVVAMRERTPITRELVERLPNLRLLVTTGPRNGVFDLKALSDHGVVVSASSYSIDSTVEMTWALALAVMRHIPAEDRVIREGGWQHAIGTQLWGNTLGIVGLGRIGSRVAAIGRAFGMHVIAWSRNLTQERCAEVGVELSTREQLYAEADVVTVHVANREGSLHAVSAGDLAQMKPTAYFINTSRGYIVDEEALVAALRDGRIAGAGLDVYQQEPLPLDHPLRRLPNTVLSPHSGYVVSEMYERWGEEVVDNIQAYLNGAPINVITPEKPALDMRSSRWGSDLDALASTLRACGGLA